MIVSNHSSGTAKRSYLQTQDLLRFLVARVGTAEPAVLAELELPLGTSLVLRRRVIAVLTLRALQDDDVSFRRHGRLRYLVTNCCESRIAAHRVYWSGKRDSNPRPSAWKADALAN